MSSPRGQAVVDEHAVGSSAGPEIDAYIASLATTFFEMEQGSRPAHSLDDLASPLAARRIQHHLHTAREASGRGRARRRTVPVNVITVRSFHPSAGAVEAAVVVELDARIRALSVRLEQEIDRWWIVEMSPPEGGLAAAITAASRTGRVPIDPDGRRRSSYRARARSETERTTDTGNAEER
jgi:hypothetical protein